MLTGRGRWGPRHLREQAVHAAVQRDVGEEREQQHRGGGGQEQRQGRVPHAPHQRRCRKVLPVPVGAVAARACIGQGSGECDTPRAAMVLTSVSVFDSMSSMLA